MAFDAIYRAKAMSVNGLTIQAFVPQVFGEAAIQITTFLGGPPISPSMGWVMFQGGNPDFPVWAGNLASGGDGGGGGGTGADEVWIGNDPPLDPGMELWYDPDDTPEGLIPASQVSFTPVGTIAATNTQAAIAEVATDAAAAIAPTAWTALPMLNGWVNYGTGYQLAQYRKHGDMVDVRGVIKSGTTSIGTQMALLPAGFRPPAGIQYVAENSVPQPGRFEVRADGYLVIIGAALSAAALNINIGFSVTA